MPSYSDRVTQLRTVTAISIGEHSPVQHAALLRSDVQALAEDADKEIAEKERKLALFKNQLSVQEQRTGEWHEACQQAERQLAEKDRQIAHLRFQFDAALAHADALLRHAEQDRQIAELKLPLCESKASAPRKEAQ